METESQNVSNAPPQEMVGMVGTGRRTRFNAEN